MCIRDSVYRLRRRSIFAGHSRKDDTQNDTNDCRQHPSQAVAIEGQHAQNLHTGQRNAQSVERRQHADNTGQQDGHRIDEREASDERMQKSQRDEHNGNRVNGTQYRNRYLEDLV